MSHSLPRNIWVICHPHLCMYLFLTDKKRKFANLNGLHYFLNSIHTLNFKGLQSVRLFSQKSFTTFVKQTYASMFIQIFKSDSKDLMLQKISLSNQCSL